MDLRTHEFIVNLKIFKIFSVKSTGSVEEHKTKLVVSGIKFNSLKLSS